MPVETSGAASGLCWCPLFCACSLTTPCAAIHQLSHRPPSLPRQPCAMCVCTPPLQDTVAVQELRFGDNDTLSAQVATLVEADYLFLLTDVDALYTANPKVCVGGRTRCQLWVWELWEVRPPCVGRRGWG